MFTLKNLFFLILFQGIPNLAYADNWVLLSAMNTDIWQCEDTIRLTLTLEVQTNPEKEMYLHFLPFTNYLHITIKNNQGTEVKSDTTDIKWNLPNMSLLKPIAGSKIVIPIDFILNKEGVLKYDGFFHLIYHLETVNEGMIATKYYVHYADGTIAEVNSRPLHFLNRCLLDKVKTI